MNKFPRNSRLFCREWKFWILKRQIFQKNLGFIFRSNYDKKIKILKGINNPLDITIKSIMTNSLIKEIYLVCQFICQEGEFGSFIIMVKYIKSLLKNKVGFFEELPIKILPIFAKEII